MMITKSMVAVTFWVEDAPAVRSQNGTIYPRKVIVEVRGDRARAVVHGPMNNSGAYRSTNFNIEGYDKYRPAPQWILDMLGEALK